MSTTIPTDPAARRALVRDLVAHAEQGLSFLGWQAAIWHAFPEGAKNLGRALLVIAETRYALDLAEALSISLPVRRPQNHRRR